MKEKGWHPNKLTIPDRREAEVSQRSEAGFAEVCFLECFVCLDNLQQCCELIMNHHQLS